MAQFEQKFGKYAVSMDNDMGDGATGCWISYKTRTKEYTASLECASRTGELESSDGYAHNIESAIVDDIEAWAVENGY